MIVWAESGATKAEWLLVENGQVVKQLTTAGIRIGHTHEIGLRTILNTVAQNLSFEKVKQMYFFGSGCLKLEHQQLMHAYLSSIFGNAIHIQVRSDLDAAALACKNKDAGFVGILGTGSAAFYWNGTSVEQLVGGKGFPQGDEGGGADIGKRLLLSLMREHSPIKEKLENQLGPLNLFYEKALQAENPAREFAQLTHFAANHRNETWMQRLLEEAFKAYFEQVSELSPSGGTIDLVGSIAAVFYPELKQIASTFNWSIGKIVKHPLKEIIGTSLQS